MKLKRYIYIRNENPWFMDSNVEIKKHITEIEKSALGNFVESDGYAKELYQHNYFLYRIEIGNKVKGFNFQTYWTPDDMGNIPLTPIDKIITNRAVACVHIDSKSPMLQNLARIMTSFKKAAELETIVIGRNELTTLLFDNTTELNGPF